MAGIPRIWFRTLSIWRPLVLVVLAVVLAGCPAAEVMVPDGGTGGGGTGTDAPVTAKIVNFASDTQIDLTLPFVSVLYTIENMPEGAMLSTFFVPVIGVPPNVLEDGDRITIDEATTLTASQGAFEFVPATAGSGNFLAGITIVTADGMTTVDALSDGRIMVEGVPDPQFVLPIADAGEDFFSVDRGDDVLITFDAGDPENSVQWRAFYLELTDCVRTTEIPDVALDEIGTQIGSPGSGNVGAVTLATADLVGGCYQLGLSATDSGSSIATTVDRGNDELIITNIAGPIVLVVDVVGVSPPSVTFTAPGSADETIVVGANFSIQFEATVSQPGATGTITLFYDDDRIGTNGFTTIVSGLVHTDSPFVVSLPTNVPEGTINIGAAIDDGINPVQFDYAVGTITITS